MFSLVTHEVFADILPWDDLGINVTLPVVGRKKYQIGVKWC